MRAMPPNHQRIGIDRSAGATWPDLRVWSRGASIPSVVEPARRRFVKRLSYAFCFFRCPLASSTYEDMHHFETLSTRSAASESRPRMTGARQLVQPNVVTRPPIPGSHLTPGSQKLRQVRRKAAGFNQSPEPAAVGAGCHRATGSAVASVKPRWATPLYGVHVASRRWLSFFRKAIPHL